MFDNRLHSAYSVIEYSAAALAAYESAQQAYYLDASAENKATADRLFNAYLASATVVRIGGGIK